MPSIWTKRLRFTTLTLALVGSAVSAVGTGATTNAAIGDDCVVVNPSRAEFERIPAMAYRLDGSAVGQLPLARAVTADGLYADYRGSTDQAVPNFIVVGDLATGQERVVYELARDGSAGRYLDGLQFSPDGSYLSFSVSIPVAGISVRLRMIDIDGNDYFVWDAITCIEPRVLIMEYNAKFAPLQGEKLTAEQGAIWDDVKARIDEFCALLDSSNKLPYLISGPAGIYISALVNRAQEDHIVLSPKDYERSFHFLGYKLPEGKTLVLQGDVGDFTGSGLFGGSLILEGSAGNWCGAGMMKGEIRVTHNTGQNTGEWMRGGEIHVDGTIQSVGTKFYGNTGYRVLFGGKIYQKGKLLVPRALVKEG